MINIIKRAWNALAHPEIRLKADFPWSFGTMAKQYVIATILNIIGSLVPVFAFTLVLAYIARNNPDLAETLIGSDPKHPNMAILAVPVVLSFLAGFGLQLWYIRRCFHKAGLTLRQSVALNLDSLGGSWWSALWRAGVAFALVIGLEMLLSLLPLPKPEGPAEQLVRQIGAGWGFWAFAAIAVIGAPLFEEFVFRGFLFNVCRTSFRKGLAWRIFRTERIADWAAIAVSAFCFAAGHMTLSGLPALFVMGCLLAALYRRSGTLICPIMLHAMNNLMAMILLYQQLNA